MSRNTNKLEQSCVVNCTINRYTVCNIKCVRILVDTWKYTNQHNLNCQMWYAYYHILFVDIIIAFEYKKCALIKMFFFTLVYFVSSLVYLPYSWTPLIIHFINLMHSCVSQSHSRCNNISINKFSSWNSSCWCNGKEKHPCIFMPIEVLIEDFEIELLTLLNQQNKSIKAKRFMGWFG